MKYIFKILWKDTLRTAAYTREKKEMCSNLPIFLQSRIGKYFFWFYCIIYMKSSEILGLVLERRLSSSVKSKLETSVINSTWEFDSQLRKTA